MIHIVDYGLGNLGSIRNMLRRLGINATLTSDPAALVDAERLILPGVGAFDTGMQRIAQSGLREVLDRKVLAEKTPVLGICLGMQLITRRSAEGNAAGLGWVDAETVHLSAGVPPGESTLRFPHIGWNFIEPTCGHPLTEGLPAEPRFYFVHSYCVRCSEPGDVLAESRYGDIRFTAILAHGNVAGAQFHPEKSHRFGMQLLRNFATWRPAAGTATT